MRYHYTCNRVADVLKTDYKKFQGRHKAKGTLIHCGYAKWYRHLEKTQQFLMKLNLYPIITPGRTYQE